MSCTPYKLADILKRYQLKDILVVTFILTKIYYPTTTAKQIYYCYIYLYVFSFDMTIGIVKSIFCYFYINTYYQHIIGFNKVQCYKCLI